MAPPETLRIAVIGSGPAGIYTAEALTRQESQPVTVDVLDRLPAPYGLVRYGVAPDHTKIKGVAGTLRRSLEHPNVRFLGGVEFGRDLALDDLRRAYHAVVFSTGASVDRRLGVPGEDLAGSVAATDFVNWYCAHPDMDASRFLLDSEEVAVVGAGNVALDVVRILAKSVDELRHTDIPEPMLEVLRASKVRRVHLVARRGPLQARFTAPELRDIGRLENADVVVDPAQVDIDPNSEAVATAARAARTNLKYLREWADRPRAERPRSVEFTFWRRPVRLLGADRVSGLEIEPTELDDEGRLRPAGAPEVLDVGMVFRSIGYMGVGLPDVPFDTASRTVPNDEGRVVTPEGTPLRGVYVAGWIKRGATGVIGTNKSDAAATVRSLLSDLPDLDTGPRVPVEDILDQRGARTVSYSDWQDIDTAERALGESLERGERVKLHAWEEMYGAIGS
ncbi:FAD-dependent oxidoreductase [Spiractinospora alimapuensis]|uniref:FAD-dependent oxidoreductase n=1 Tax=Spiractinospora alimapuensis TaxID=2820884 RepID=UPI001F285BE9|nr:FAD-dependent oxidoreductase [Spiractinospora alimapuensis]QVQ52408.1 FAD-dependent oxidoreductase [Spiractinospora alimapuensis]